MDIKEAEHQEPKPKGRWLTDEETKSAMDYLRERFGYEVNPCDVPIIFKAYLLAEKNKSAIAKAQDAKTASIKDAVYEDLLDLLDAVISARDKACQARVKKVIKEIEKLLKSAPDRNITSIPDSKIWLTLKERELKPDNEVARIMSEDGQTGVATGANKPAENMTEQESREKIGKIILKDLGFNSLSEFIVVKDAECQARMERIFKKIESLFIPKEAWVNCHKIHEATWQALKKQELKPQVILECCGQPESKCKCEE